MTLLPLAPLVGGIALLVVGFLGLTGRLARNPYAGVRTSATMRDEETFRVGNKVAGLPTAAGGVIGVLGALVGWVADIPLLATLLATAGLLALTVAGGVLGHRAAAAVPEPAPEQPAGCKGCQCGGCGAFQKG